MIKATNSVQRMIGKPLHFGQKQLTDVISRKELILEELHSNGCICLKGIKFEPPDMVRFT